MVRVMVKVTQTVFSSSLNAVDITGGQELLG